MFADGSGPDSQTQGETMSSTDSNVPTSSQAQAAVDSDCTVVSSMVPGVTSPTSAHPPASISTIAVASSAAEYQQDTPDTKEGIEELCPVCGDKVSGYHYGLLTCESCKGFFKRTVQNKKVYTCVADRSCHIDKSQRKRCPFCRFQKCLDVGMKLEAVRADRMRGGRNKFGPMYKRDRARKLQIIRQKQMSRSPCQGTSNGEVVVSGQNATYIPSGSSVGVNQPIYSPEGGSVKQELIQIPQLSSSTSSPDSSPSPISTTVPVTSLGHFTAPSTQMHSPAPTVSETVKVSWVATHTTTTPSPSTPSPGHSNISPTALSPKAFPFDSPSVAVPPALPPPPPSPLAQSLTLPTSSPGSIVLGCGKVPPLIREFQMSMMDDKEWQSQLFGLLQNQTYNQCEVDLFELMCKVLDQSLFAQVDWARNSIFFKDLKVDDQMKLLQQSWSEMLILDHMHQRLHNSLPDETTLPNGQKFELLTLTLLGMPALSEHLHRVSNRFQELKFDPLDYICLKFLLLLNPEVRGLNNSKLVHDAHEQTQQTLLEYTVNCYPQVSDKFRQLLNQIPELRVISTHGEDYLYYKHISGKAPSQTLLMEMLHAKRK